MSKAKVEVVVAERLRLDARGLTEGEISDVKEMFEHKNPERQRKKAMGVPHWDEPEVYRTWKGGPGAISVPRGGTDRLRAYFGKRLTFRDRRACPPCEMPPHAFTLRGYQEEGRDVALKHENCILRSPTGSGKTVIALATVAAAATPALIVLWNSALLKQWRGDVCTQLGFRERDVGHIQGSKLKLAPVTLAMNQTLWKLDERARAHVRAYFGTLVMDEVHRAAARTFMDVVDWMPMRYRVGLTADERRKDRREFLIHDQFGKVAFDVDQAQLEEEGATLDVEVRVLLTGLEAEWFKTEDRQAHARLLEQITWDDRRTELAAEVARLCVNDGHQTIVFSHRREHCERLRAAIRHRGFECGLMLGGPADAEELDRSIRGLRSGALRVAVGTVQAIGTGIDLPSVSRGVVATPLASNRQLWGQVRGRLCRSADGKDDAVAYYLHDESPLGETAVRMLKRWNRSCFVLPGGYGGIVVEVKDWLAARPSTRDSMLEGLGAAL